MSRILLVIVAGCLSLPGVASAQRAGQGHGHEPHASPPTPPAAPAEPTPSDRARELFQRGQGAYQQGDYAGAVQVWEQAYALDPRPALQFNLAQAYGRLGRTEDELAALRRFVDTAPPTDSQVETARARLTTLEQRIARTAIVVRGQAYDGAVILVDGEDRGRLPHPDPLLLRPGTHVVDVSLDGYVPFHSTVVVPAGDVVELAVTMARMAAASEREAHPMRLPIALYATGGALVVAGSVFGGLALAKSSGAVEGSHAADQAHSFAVVADVAIGVGVATAATGLVFHLLRRHRDDSGASSAPAVSFSPVVTPTGGGFAAFGRFGGAR